MKYYTSDLHLSHKKIIEYENRPFDDIISMNQKIFNNINEVAGLDDELYILGDFTLETKRNKVFDLISSIRCKNLHLIVGNHDCFIKDNTLHYLFKSISYYKEIFDEDRKIILFHYPILDWNQKHNNSIHLYGHIHSNKEYKLKDLNGINVGMDINNFYPKTLNQLLEDRKNGLI